MGLNLKEKEDYNKSNKVLLENLLKSSTEVKKAIFVEVIALMLVDGMKDEEKALLSEMQNKFNFDDKFKNDAINWYSEILPLYKKGFALVGIGSAL
jgi:hypothetical protein